MTRNPERENMTAPLKFTLAFLAAAAAVLLLFLAMREGCVLLCFSDVNGTWVRAEDYADGFDPDDEYIEITAHGDFSICGEYIGPASFSHEIGCYTVYEINGTETQWIFDGYQFYVSAQGQLVLCYGFSDTENISFVFISERTGLDVSQREKTY